MLDLHMRSSSEDLIHLLQLCNYDELIKHIIEEEEAARIAARRGSQDRCRRRGSQDRGKRRGSQGRSRRRGPWRWWRRIYRI